MDSREIRELLRSKNWVDDDSDFRFINQGYPYVIVASGDEIRVSLRENAGTDNGQNGEEVYSFRSIDELQEWFEDYIGE